MEANRIDTFIDKLKSYHSGVEFREDGNYYSEDIIKQVLKELK